MSKEKCSYNQYKTKTDVERYLKSDKSFMANRSAAEFNAFVEGAMFIISDKEPYIEKLRERIKNNTEKILNLENELAPYRELYEDYDIVERKGKKNKNKFVFNREDSEDDGILSFEDEYNDLDNENF